MSHRGLTARLARRAADCRRLPTAQRAVFGYYAETGTFDYQALEVKSRVDDVLDAILDELYGEVEAALAEEFDRSPGDVSFEYETKLTLPAELTLSYLYRRARTRATNGFDPLDGSDEESTQRLAGIPKLTGRTDTIAGRQRTNQEAAAYAEEAREMTAFVVAALIDGDMRDAINDDEFEDFVVHVDGTDGDTDELTSNRRRVAVVAQSSLQSRVEAGFEAYPPAVRRAYDHAVELSEAHQDDDERFRALMTAVAEGTTDDSDLSPEAARDAIESEYRHRPMADDDHPFTSEELDLPYLSTQYDRVGVIYHGMLEMYRAVGFDIEPAFERSIVFAIIGAQVWLDDVDDYHDDVADGQLTPVTAAYLLADDDTSAYEQVVDVSEAYFDRAREYATAVDSTLTGIAVEYILRSGDVSHLPGATD